MKKLLLITSLLSAGCAFGMQDFGAQMVGGVTVGTQTQEQGPEASSSVVSFPEELRIDIKKFVSIKKFVFINQLLFAAQTQTRSATPCYLASSKNASCGVLYSDNFLGR